jgi:hypothetical protein
MLDRALAYLLATRLKNAGRHLLERPGRLVTVVFTVAIFVLIAVTGGLGRTMDPADRSVVLASLLAFNLVIGLLAGLGEQGLGFTPADLDFVFPGPFPRRDLLLYHLLRHYAGLVVLAAMYTLFLGPFPRPLVAYLAILLCLLVGTHLQAASTLAVAALGDRVFGRLRILTRTALVLFVCLGMLLMLVAAVGTGDVAGLLARFLASAPAQVLLFPAVAGADAAVAPRWDAAAWPLLGLWLALGASFGLALLFRVDFLETSVATTEAGQRRRGGGGAPRRRRARSARGFRGGAAGAVVWLNALTLRRRIRMVLGAVFLLTILLLVSQARAERAGGQTLPTLVPVLAFFAVMVNLPLGFRGQRAHLAFLKSLPIRPFHLALAEVLVPAGLVYALQAAVLLVFHAAGTISAGWLMGGLAVYPVVDLGVVALTDLFHLGREPGRMGLFATMLQMLALTASLVPGALAGALALGLSDSLAAAVGLGLLVHALVVLLVLRLLAGRFERFEAASAEA